MSGRGRPTATRGLPALAAAFVALGLFWGTWAVTAADVRRFLDVGYGRFGALLTVAIAGGAAATAAAGPLVERIGTTVGLTAAEVAFGALVVLLAWTGWPVAFALLLVAAVAANGAVDVVMNVAATAALASEPGRLVRFHALFNAGAVLGAGASGLVLAAHESWRWVWLAAGLAQCAVGLAVRRADLPAGGRGGEPPPWQSLATIWRSGLVVLAVAFACGAMAEGGLDTWGVLFLRSRLAVGTLLGAGAYVAGQALATTARVTLGPSAGLLGGAGGARAGGALAAVGLLVEAAAPTPLVGAAGLAAAAVGISLYWPLLLSEASQGLSTPGLVVGGVTAAGYVGFLVGPSVFGFTAARLGLRAGVLTLAAAALVVAAAPIRGRRPLARPPVEPV